MPSAGLRWSFRRARVVSQETASWNQVSLLRDNFLWLKTSLVVTQLTLGTVISFGLCLECCGERKCGTGKEGGCCCLEVNRMRGNWTAPAGRGPCGEARGPRFPNSRSASGSARGEICREGAAGAPRSLQQGVTCSRCVVHSHASSTWNSDRTTGSERPS